MARGMELGWSRVGGEEIVEWAKQVEAGPIYAQFCFSFYFLLYFLSSSPFDLKL
jgi:hypothetical protein